MDDSRTNGIPLAADVAGVAAHIDALRPAGARVEVAAPLPLVVPVTISGLSPDTVETREAVVAELADLFGRAGRVSTLSEPYTLHLSKIDEAISIASGEDSHTLLAPAGNIAVPLGHVPVLGAVSFG